MTRQSGTENTNEAVGEAARKRLERFGHGCSSIHPAERRTELGAATGDAR